MAVLSPTVTTILQVISDLRGESAINSDTVRIRMISRSALDFSLRKRWKIFLRPNITASGDGSTNAFTIGNASFPCRPNGLDEVFVGGTTEDKRYQTIDYNQYKKLYNNNNAAQIVYQYYDQTNDLMKMYINPVPALGTNNITYSYFFQHPAVTAVTDVVYCNDPIVIAKMALADLYHSEDELQKELQQRQDVEQLINQYFGDDNSPANNQLYAMGAIESSITNKGIGGY